MKTAIFFIFLFNSSFSIGYTVDYGDIDANTTKLPHSKSGIISHDGSFNVVPIEYMNASCRDKYKIMLIDSETFLIDVVSNGKLNVGNHQISCAAKKCLDIIRKSRNSVSSNTPISFSVTPGCNGSLIDVSRRLLGGSRNYFFDCIRRVFRPIIIGSLGLGVGWVLSNCENFIESPIGIPYTLLGASVGIGVGCLWNCNEYVEDLEMELRLEMNRGIQQPNQYIPEHRLNKYQRN